MTEALTSAYTGLLSPARGTTATAVASNRLGGAGEHGALTLLLSALVAVLSG